MPTAAQSSAIVTPTLHDSRRLHITPLTKELLPKVLGSLLPLAKEVSFHTLPNFPNRGYGFVTLPSTEAAMVKKRLQGTILRGEKVAIEDARSDTRKEKATIERQKDIEAGSETEPPVRTLRKRKRQDGMIPGAIELSEGRKVKRGWTESEAETEARRIKEKRDRKTSKNEKRDKKMRVKSSGFTDQEECLFQTAIPRGAGTGDKMEQDKRSRKKGKKSKDSVTVHEFENTTKYPRYLRDSTNKDKKPVQEYDEDKGWVDEEGNLIEAAIKSPRKQKSGRDSQARTSMVLGQKTTLAEASEETSSSGSSSDSEETDESDSDTDTADVMAKAETEDSLPGVKPELSIREPSPTTPHPLETLFKKPKPPSGEQSTRSSLEINTSFTFFGSNDADEEEAAARPVIEKSLETPGLPALRRRGLPNLSIPVTPYTQRDMQWRSQRSAAPTPDTAAPSKSGFGDPFGLLASIHKDKEEAIEEEKEDDNDDEAEDVMEGIEGEDASGTPPVQSDSKADGKESDFAKWFWENRGANTRAWKQRKREAAKEQRSRESRKRKA